jgi:twitching motility two-component system response regulator PilG
MTSKKLFSVTAIGISDIERKVLRNIFRLSQHRVRSYALLDNSASTPEIALFDTDAAGTDQLLAHWRQRHPSVPTVLITREPPSKDEPYRIRRPFVATRVLSMLDQIVIKELSYVPELVIGENNDSDNSASSDNTRELVSKAAEGAAQSAAQNARHKALVVDDSLPVRKQIEIELKLLGVNADFAESGEDAFAMLDSNTYDIIFLDVVLPGVDGYKICKTIKKNKIRKATPVIMLTSKSSPFDRIRGTFAGCNTYLTKPVSHESFQKVVKHYLRP